MHILAVDIGTGTQDVLLFDTDKEPENAMNLVMPSPTVLLAQAIRAITQTGDDLLLVGVTMGGGPCTWAVEEHLQAGHRVFAGHMPGAPILPGVLLIEAIAQTGAIVLLSRKGPPPPDRAAEHGHLVRVENVRFRKPVYPGMELRCKVELIGDSRPPLYHIKGRAFADGQLAATAEVVITVPEGLA